MRMTGVVQTTDCDAFRIYFVADIESASAATAYGVYHNNNQVLPGGRFAEGSSHKKSKEHAGAYVCYDNNGDKDARVEARVALSIVSEAHALAELQKQNVLSFKQVAHNAQQEWRSILERVALSPDTPAETVTKFYSALYHTAMAPTLYSEDLDGNATRGCDNKVRKLPHRTYSDLSMWDIHRSEFPWLTAFLPEVATDALKSLQETARRCTYMPKWPLGTYNKLCVCIYLLCVCVCVIFACTQFRVSSQLL